MSQPRDDLQDDLFGPSLEKFINLDHPLVRMAADNEYHPFNRSNTDIRLIAISREIL
jgi:hypothetical protein